MAIQNRLLAYSVITLLFCASILNAQEVLTNESVLNLHKAGLSAEIIAAKVKQAKDVAFALETDDLLALREAGLPSEVITAMLERTTESNEASSASTNPFGDMQDDLGFGVVRVQLLSSTGPQKIRLARGEFSVAAFGHLRYMNYNSLYARVRTDESRPVLHVESAEPLDGGKYFLVELDVDEDDGVRSLKVSSARKGFRAAFGGSTIGMMEPDDDWVIPWEVELIEGDLWRVTAKKDLPPGEYGLYVDMGSGSMQGGGLFGFGVGAAPSN